MRLVLIKTKISAYINLLVLLLKIKLHQTEISIEIKLNWNFEIKGLFKATAFIV